MGQEIKNILDDELLDRYLHGECTESDFEALNKWLGESEDNRRILFDMKLAVDSHIKDSLSEEKNVARAEAIVMNRVRKGLQGAPRKRTGSRTVIRWCIAAAVLLGAGAVYYGTVISGDDIVFAVGAGGPVEELMLPDGTKVWLNASSTLKYSDKFSANNRSVFLDGEAYFEVVRNPSAPFTVESNSIKVRVLGTTFNMKSFEDAHTAEATLIEGEIEIRGNNSEGQVILAPGQRAEVDMAAKRLTVREVKNARLDGIWRDNLISFNQTTIYSIAETLEQLYNIRIVFTEGNEITNRYTGVIRRKDSIEEVLNSLKNSIPIIYTVSGDTIYIARSRSRQ